MTYNKFSLRISVYESEIRELYKKIDDLNLKRLKLESKSRKLECGVVQE